MSKTDTTALKGLSILFVLLGHMNYLDASGAWGVHIFLILSGLGLEISYDKNGLSNYWKKRISKVFIPYEFVVLFALLIENIAISHLAFNDIIASVLGLDFGYNIDHSMWYISYLFLLYGEFYIWKKCGTNKIVKMCFPVLFILFNFLLSVFDRFFSIVIWSPTAQVWIYCVDFFVGVILAHVPVKKSKQVYNLLAIAMILYFVARYGYIHFKIDMFLFTMSAASISIILGQKFGIGKIAFLRIIGECSYFVYLIEGHMLRWKSRFFCWIKNDDHRNITVLFLCIILGMSLQRIFDILYSKIEGKELKR